MAKKSSGPKSKEAQDLGKKGGTSGGPARAKKLTPEQRQAIAKQGGKAKAVNKKTKGG
jgi:Spy/CpxP family protein refolding chaperone